MNYIYVTLLIIVLVLAAIVVFIIMKSNHNGGAECDNIIAFSTSATKCDTITAFGGSVIKKAEIEDVPKIKELADEYMKMVGHYEEKTEEQLAGLVLNDSDTFVYKDQDEKGNDVVKGFITIMTSKQLLRLLIVDSKYRNQKIGTKLMDYIATQNYPNLSLYIEKNNPFYDVLVKFYSKYGYKIVEEQHFIKMSN